MFPEQMHHPGGTYSRGIFWCFTAQFMGFCMPPSYNKRTIIWPGIKLILTLTFCGVQFPWMTPGNLAYKCHLFENSEKTRTHGQELILLNGQFVLPIQSPLEAEKCWNPWEILSLRGNWLSTRTGGQRQVYICSFFHTVTGLWAGLLLLIPALSLQNKLVWGFWHESDHYKWCGGCCFSTGIHSLKSREEKKNVATINLNSLCLPLSITLSLLFYGENMMTICPCRYSWSIDLSPTFKTSSEFYAFLVLSCPPKKMDDVTLQ